MIERSAAENGSNSAAIEQARAKLVQIYRYLQALNDLRNPVTRKIDDQPWVAWLTDLPQHESVRRGKVGELADEDFVLKVGRPVLSPVPTPPEPIVEWLQPGWDRLDGAAEVLPVREEQTTDGSARSVLFENDPARVRAFRDWSSERDRWIETETPARQALALFERLYALRGRIEREAERVELVVGDGLLEWDRIDGNRVRHPVLLQRVELQFEPAIPEFTIAETEQAVELYTALLSSMPDVQPQFVSECQAELDETGVDPLGGDDTDQFLRRLVTRVSPRGAFVGADPTEGVAISPRISRAPVLFLRSRTLGLGEAIAAILDDLQTRDDLPDAVTRIVGIEPEEAQDDEVHLQADTWNGEHEDILFSKEANAEQLEIAQRLERYGSVLVQGPPGTGKTHTIANLVGHLLAEGKSVLVTSHTAKALTVLREKVVEPLRPLCLSVGVPIRDAATGVESEGYSRKLMENAIDEITERLSSASAPALMRDAEILAKERLGLLQRLREARARLQSARQDEYRLVVVAGVGYPPAQAAREVAAGMSDHGWIPTPVAAAEPLPLTPGEIVELYSSNTAVTSQDEVELSGSLPAVSDLTSPTEFESLSDERTHLLATDLSVDKELWAEGKRSDATLRRLLTETNEAVRLISDDGPWRMAAISAGREGGPARASWDSLLLQVDDVVQLAAEAQEPTHRHGPTLPATMPLDEAIEISREIREHLKGDRRLGRVSLMLHRRWKSFIDSARVGANVPETAGQFAALEQHARLKLARTELVARWERQMAPLGAPIAANVRDEPEAACRQYCAAIAVCLDWFSGKWVPLQEQLRDSGFLWDAFLASVPPRLEQNGDLMRLRDAVAANLAIVVDREMGRIRLDAISTRIDDLVRQLAPYETDGVRGSVVRRLREAAASSDSEAYHAAYERLVEIEGRRAILARRRSSLEKLERVAPGWAAAIRERVGVHGEGSPPGDAQRAWVWRQLYEELERRGATSIAALQEDIAGLAADLRRATAALIEKRAWAYQVERTTLSQRQALLGWKATVRKIGKGTGIRAPLLRAEARRLMPECQAAVPVWVMPLSLVVQNFHPARNRFDVVIIDEASQADVMSLVALYLGRQVVVVGDHEQVSPDAVGQAIANVQQLIDTHLLDIPNRHLYDPQLSLYDLAMMSFEGIVCLREHFRCVPDIIEFSNLLSYEGKIKPLRDASSVLRQPFTVSYRVEGANEGSRANRAEALTIASLVVACTEQPEYDGATLGVISLVGDEQAYQIESILRRRLTVSDFIARMIRCGNSAQFQGDERDVMFLSVVDAPATDGPLPLRSDGANGMFKKRFNVASSRACDQMWVVHSLDEATDLKQGDLRKRLIEHAKDPRALSRDINTKSETTESEFERLVLARLIAEGFRVTPQWRVGAYRIDMVVEGNGRRLAIECDGDRWHPEEQIADDMARQAILERLGWQFVRIRGSQFFRAPDAAMLPVFERLAQLGIGPDASAAGGDNAHQERELLDRVVRRAAELRDDWTDEEDEPAPTPRAPGWERRNASTRSSEPTVEMVAPAQESASVADDDPMTPSRPAAPPPKAARSPDRLLAPETSVGPDELVSILEERRIAYVDKRPSGGAIWAVGGRELSPLMADLAKRGYKFKFTPGGGRATGYQPAWWFAK